MAGYYDKSEGNQNRIGASIRAQQRLAESQSQSTSNSALFGPGYEEISAPTTQSSFPRALACGYNQDTETLVVIFRDKTWVQYDEIPFDMWDDLKQSNSTGKYLRYSGIDGMPWKRTSYGSLPRKRVDSLQLGIDEAIE